MKYLVIAALVVTLSGCGGGWADIEGTVTAKKYPIGSQAVCYPLDVAGNSQCEEVNDDRWILYVEGTGVGFGPDGVAVICVAPSVWNDTDIGHKFTGSESQLC